MDALLKLYFLSFCAVCNQYEQCINSANFHGLNILEDSEISGQWLFEHVMCNIVVCRKIIQIL